MGLILMVKSNFPSWKMKGENLFSTKWLLFLSYTG